MYKIKNQKGITLVALVITIIVLLILAVVAIGAVRDSGIIGHAQNSADKYNTGKLEENTKLGEYENEISKYYGEEDSGNQNDGVGIVGFYGNRDYMALEVITETTGKFYKTEENETTILDVTFSNNKIMVGEEELGSYSFNKIEGVNNKAIVIAESRVLTTNGSVGLGANLLDGNTYESTYIDISFENGMMTQGANDSKKYYIYDSKILIDDSNLDNCFFAECTDLSSDYSTFIWENYTYTLKQ